MCYQKGKSMTAALELEGLRKHFGDKVAVDGISLTVPAGSFYGVLGPNGAGKTTALSMAVGLLRPDAGHSRVFGYDVWSDPVTAKALIGVLPDGLAMPERLTGREVLTYLGMLRGIDRAELARRTDDLLGVMELDQEEKTLVIEYSTGMRKKIGLAVALLHAPRLLVLDEPFEAVDPVSAAAIRAILQGFVNGGGSVVISSHVMALVEGLCDYVAVVNDGRIAAAGPIADVRADRPLEDAFASLVGAGSPQKAGLSWLSR
jgi:ABC-2 type transport system ATP-binding protein